MAVAAGDGVDRSGRYMSRASGAQRASQTDASAERSFGEGVRARPQKAGPTGTALCQQEHGGREERHLNRKRERRRRGRPCNEDGVVEGFYQAIQRSALDERGKNGAGRTQRREQNREPVSLSSWGG